MTLGQQQQWPLIGRDGELATAVAAARRVRRPAGIVLAGAAGVGTTRLARETLAALGRPVRWVAGSRSARSLPWGALAPLLGREPSSITAAVTALSGSGGVLAVDDAHLLDDATAAAVRHVALLGRAAVVVTVRSGAPTPDAVTALWKDDTLPRLDLAPLSADAGRALVEAALGAPVDALTAARLHALIRGNPQLLRRVVEDELAAGRLRACDGVWRWRSRFVPSAHLLDLVAARAAGPGETGTLPWTDPRGALREVALREVGDTPDPAAQAQSLRAAVARLDADAVERLVRHLPDEPEVGRARMWAAGVRGVEPVDRTARAVHRAAVGGRPDEAVALLPASAGVRAALAVVNGDPPQAVDRADAWGALAAALAAALAGAPFGDAVERGQDAAARSVGTAWLNEDLAGVAALALRLAGVLDAVPVPEIEPDLGPSAAATRVVTAGLLALDRGLVATAVRDLGATAVEPGEPWIGWCGWAAQQATGLAQALAMAGDHAGAKAALAGVDGGAGPAVAAADRVPGAAVAAADRVPGPAVAATDRIAGPAAAAVPVAVPGWLRPQVALAQAWVAAAEGATSEAVRHARRAGDLACAAGQAAVEIVARHTAVRFGDCAAADRLAELARRVDTPRAALAAAHAAALADDDGPGLDAVATRWAETGALALAADAAAQAALAHRARGARGSALAAGARADRWAARCEGLRTPALLAAARPLPLTEREREMTMLASTGLTNRAIAERLCVSVRTVEGHLYRACAKLAVPNRAELAAVLRGA